MSDQIKISIPLWGRNILINAGGYLQRGLPQYRYYFQHLFHLTGSKIKLHQLGWEGKKKIERLTNRKSNPSKFIICAYLLINKQINKIPYHKSTTFFDWHLFNFHEKLSTEFLVWVLFLGGGSECSSHNLNDIK